MSKAVRAGRRAGSSRLFKSAYRKSQRIPAILALIAMLWYSAVPAGAVTVQVRRIGYRNFETAVTLAVGQAYTGDYRLTASVVALRRA